jgi:hypothetical protein
MCKPTAEPTANKAARAFGPDSRRKPTWSTSHDQKSPCCRCATIIARYTWLPLLAQMRSSDFVEQCPSSRGGLNRSTQHFMLKERWSVEFGAPTSKGRVSGRGKLNLCLKSLATEILRKANGGGFLISFSPFSWGNRICQARRLGMPAEKASPQ